MTRKYEIQKPVSEQSLEELIVHTDDEPHTKRSLSIEDLESGEGVCDNAQLSSENALDQKERLDGIQKALACLDEHERVIIHKTFFEGKGQMVISSETGISQHHVSKILNRALSKLKSNPAIREAFDKIFDRTYPKGSRREPGAE